MGKTYKQLENELLDKEKAEKNLRLRLGTWRSRAIRDRKLLKSMSTQYEKVALEHKKNFDTLMNNAPKLFFVYLHNRVSEKLGR